jgi:protein transport protein SEC24
VGHFLSPRASTNSRYRANVANLPHYTTGQTYYYPAFNAARSEDALKFAHEFGEVLAMPIMLECITRVRASRGAWFFIDIFTVLTPHAGLRMASFHGNFFVRSTDLLAMPTVPQNQSYAIEIDIEDTLTSPFVVLQTGMLHTTCFGSFCFNFILACAFVYQRII